MEKTTRHVFRLSAALALCALMLFPPASVAKENHLAKAKSPYLRLYKDSPVEWREWGPEALNLAKKLDKPLFISIGYFSCHYCRLMAQETFSNPEAARLINDKFIPVMVDRQERPGLDLFYQAYLRMTVGKSGWPMTIFAQPDGAPYSGAGSFISARQRDGSPGLVELATEALRIYVEEPDRLTQNSHILKEAYASVNSPKRSGEPEPSTEETMESLRKLYDRTNGGFAETPKFPNEPALLFIMENHAAVSDDLAFAQMSLEWMAQGAVRDHINGGFFRYASDDSWANPWLEKILSRNAMMSALYTKMYSPTADRFFLDVAVETANWVLGDLYRPGGGFWASQYSDGSFYLWTKGDAIKILGPSLGALFAEHMNLSDKKTAPAVADAPKSAMSVETMISAKEILRAETLKKRPAPALEKMALSSWSALMAESLVHVYEATGNEKYLTPALRTMDFIRNSMTVKNVLRHSYYEGLGTGEESFLEDYACAISLALTIFEATQDNAHLAVAEDMAKQARKLFTDNGRGGFFFTTPWAHTPLVRLKIRFDGSTPSPSAIMTRNMARLYALTGNMEYGDIAKRAAADLKLVVGSSIVNMGTALGTADMVDREAKQLILVGGADGAVVSQLYRELRNAFIPGAVTSFVLPDKPETAPEPFRDLKPEGGEPTLYVCEDFECEEPVAGHKAIREALEKLAVRIR
ncbi:MAG: thioredoxin domain-containing protein [Nitrospinae bacterium]|nr:thioredoxin domain-containing protein [Nitrospinota bacterium]